MYVCGCLVVKECPTLCNPMDCEAWLHSPWNFPGKNTGVGCHFFLQGNLCDPGIKPASPAWQADSLQLSHRGCPYMCGRKDHFRLIHMVGKTILGWYSIQRVSYSKRRKETLTRSNLQFLFYKRLFWVWHTGSSRVETIYPSWTEEPGGLQSIGLQRFRQHWETSLSLGFIMNSVVVFIC